MNLLVAEVVLLLIQWPSDHGPNLEEKAPRVRIMQPGSGGGVVSGGEAPRAAAGCGVEGKICGARKVHFRSRGLKGKFGGF